ncbi:MAG: hypothetical protein WCH93_12365 [Actinomycetota bacterium]
MTTTDTPKARAAKAEALRWSPFQDLASLLDTHATSYADLPPFYADNAAAAASVIAQFRSELSPLAQGIPGMLTTADLAPWYYTACTSRYGQPLDQRNEAYAHAVPHLWTARLMPESDSHLVTVLHRNGNVSVCMAALAPARGRFARPSWYSPDNAAFFVERCDDATGARELIEDITGAIRLLLRAGDMLADRPEHHEVRLAPGELPD